MSESPAVVLFDSVNAVALAVADGVAYIANTTGLLAAGIDGTSNTRFFRVDSTGRQIIVGAGTAGSPTGGVVSIQGVVGGTVIPISGTVTATNASIGLTGAPVPTSATQMGASDGTNLQAPRVFDLDTGAGEEWNLGVSIRLPGAGGSVVGGTGTNPIRIDPTGTTTQPISAASLPLPTGAATEATLASRLADATFTTRINTLGQKAMAASTPVVLASDQSPISTTPLTTSTATHSDVGASVTTVTLLAANANRLGATIYHDATVGMLSVRYGSGASSSNRDTVLMPGGTLRVPYSYTGIITGIWSVASGNARVAEFTA